MCTAQNGLQCGLGENKVKQCETVWVCDGLWLEDVRDICISEKYDIVSSNYHGGLAQHKELEQGRLRMGFEDVYKWVLKM